MKRPLNELKDINNPRWNPTLGVLDARKNRDAQFGCLPPGMSPQGYVDFVTEKWELYSAFAYDAYKKAGKGVLLVDWDDSFLPELAHRFDGYLPKDDLPAAWFSEGIVASFIRSGVLKKDWLRLIKEYNPEIMMILALHWGTTEDSFGNSTVKTIAMPGRLSPKDSYLKMRGRLPEFTFIFGEKSAKD